MKQISIAMALVLLAGCTTPPKTPVCRGEFRHVNKSRVAGELLGADTRLVICPANVTGERHG